ncbi:MAG: hypothetical protein GC178_03200 [Flavobacteriales bacterium]|nr:hypothetical protein [Flavobacteriales bacterium]
MCAKENRQEITLSELKKWFEIWRWIIFDLRIAIDNRNDLFEVGSDTEQKVKDHGFYHHHLEQLKFIVVIQLCKLFVNSRTQNVNIQKLFNRLKNDKYDMEFKQKLRDNVNGYNVVRSKKEIIERIVELEKELDQKKHVIERLDTLRHTVYAHSDTNPSKEYVKWSEMEDLVQFAERIFNQIRGGIDGANMNFDKNLDWRVKEVIRNAALFRDKTKELIDEKNSSLNKQ